MQIQPTKFYAAASAVSRNVQGPFDTVRQAQAIAGMRVYAGAELLSATGSAPYTAVSKAGSSKGGRIGKGGGKGSGKGSGPVPPGYPIGDDDGSSGEKTDYSKASKSPKGGGPKKPAAKGSKGGGPKEDPLDELKGLAVDLGSAVKELSIKLDRFKEADLTAKNAKSALEDLDKAYDLISDAMHTLN